MEQQSQIQRNKFRAKDHQCRDSKRVFEQLQPGQYGIGRTAQRLPDHRDTARQHLAQTGCRVVQLQCDHSLYAKQFSARRNAFSQQLPAHPAGFRETRLRVDAAGHADGQITLQQRPDAQRDPLCQQSQHAQQKSAGHRSGVSLSTCRQDCAARRQKSREEQPPAVHAFTDRLCQCQQITPDEHPAATGCRKVQQGTVRCIANEK